MKKIYITPMITANSAILDQSLLVNSVHVDGLDGDDLDKDGEGDMDDAMGRGHKGLWDDMD